ncbi:hypothetical protein [Methylobacterium nodulans]|uniref:Uncharacterized protein n=1 Tax=Methylobacterium nodulans (strain LMG 21967 / CNCM I-2342 / ORS 2060) TaxID=460265 RepID=B8IEY8_METNO|nr:hypothetical protein [Methylobacterium nodulans]ACL61481.1 conserved hypothetical protein [Methylobacterium nodulans ORS 2060]
MIGKVISSALRKKTRPEDPPAIEAGAVREPDLHFPPMPPLSPPDAQNDDPQEPLLKAIEDALRSAGFLR